MYNLNNLYRNVLITPKEVVFHAPTGHTVDVRTIEQSIIVTEERIVRPALGTLLYQDLINAKNKVVDAANIAALQAEIDQEFNIVEGDIVNSHKFLSDAYQQLWFHLLWKLTAECVLLVAYPEGFTHFTSEGVVHINPTAGPLTTGTAVTPDLKSIRWALDKKMMGRVEPLLQAMHEWLCDRKGDYPLYTKPCDCDANGVAYKRKSDIVLGLYDDEDRRCGC